MCNAGVSHMRMAKIEAVKVADPVYSSESRIIYTCEREIDTNYDAEKFIPIVAGGVLVAIPDLVLESRRSALRLGKSPGWRRVGGRCAPSQMPAMLRIDKIAMTIRSDNAIRRRGGGALSILRFGLTGVAVIASLRLLCIDPALAEKFRHVVSRQTTPLIVLAIE